MGDPKIVLTESQLHHYLADAYKRGADHQLAGERGSMRHELRWCRIHEAVEESFAPLWFKLGDGPVTDRLLARAPWIAEALAELDAAPPLTLAPRGDR